MPQPAGLSQCFSFINCQLSPPRRPGPAVETPRRLVTISRQAGSGAHVIASRLAEILEKRLPSESCRWTVFDRNLVEKVLEDHGLPARVARFMREDRISEVADTMDELFGLHPSSWTLVHNTAQTILHLAELGNVIIIGRGANVITRKLGYAFHVRLIGSHEKRLKHLQEAYGMNERQAASHMKSEDEGRQRFMKKYFDEDLDSALGYHLVINTDLVGYENAAELIAEGLQRLKPEEAKAVAA